MAARVMTIHNNFTTNLSEFLADKCIPSPDILIEREGRIYDGGLGYMTLFFIDIF